MSFDLSGSFSSKQKRKKINESIVQEIRVI